MKIRLTLVILLCIACRLYAQEEAEKSTYVNVSAYTYFVPDDQDYTSATVAVDHNRLHLEARYNYEDLETGSAWIGANFSAGEEWVFEATPMVGAMFGNTDGMAPGWKLSLSYHMLALYSENEYVFDFHDSSGNFYYNWSEVTLSPLDWLRFGIVIQRTKVYETEFDIQRGLLLGISMKNVSLTTHVFNLDADRPTVVLSAGVDF